MSLHRKTTKQILLEILKSEKPRHLDFNAVVHRVIDYASMNGIDEPSFAACYTRLKEMCIKGKIKHDSAGYFFELRDDKSARLTTWLPQNFPDKKKIKIAKEETTQ